MNVSQIHAGLSNTSVMFIAILGFWGLLLRFRNQPLNSSWFGAAVIGELLMIAQALTGVYLYWGIGLGVVLQRPFLHILYGIVAIITLPAAWGYFGQLQDEKIKALAMAATCLFLWGILLRASQVAMFAGPTA